MNKVNCYNVLALYKDGKEEFSANVNGANTLDEHLMYTKIPKQRAGTLLLQFLSLTISQEAYIEMLALFVGCDNACNYAEEHPQEFTQFCDILQRVKQYIDFHEENEYVYDEKFFKALIEAKFFNVPLSYLTSTEIDVALESFQDKNTGLLIDDISILYANFNRLCDPKSALFQFSDNHLTRIVISSLWEIIRSGKQIKRCKNCKKYFLPSSRSDEIYCDNPSPQEAGLSCKQYGTRRLWYERQQKDEIASLAKKVASAKCMLAKRNPDIKAYTDAYEYFKEQRLIWMKAVKNGEKTQDEYKDWLLYMQRQKTIKEAFHGND